MISGFYAGLLWFIFFILSLRVIGLRRKLQRPYDPGDSIELRASIAAHTNFSQYIPFALFLLYINETEYAVAPAFVHIIGVALLLGRLLHYRGLVFSERQHDFQFRKIGMHLKFWPVIILASLCILGFIRNMIVLD